MSACGINNNSNETTSSDDGVGDALDAINDAMGDELTDETTNNLENDLPEAYQFGDWSNDMMLKKMPEPVGNVTVSNTEANPDEIQVLYLWEEGNVPATTSFTEEMTGYFDEYDFRPYATIIPVKDGVTPKGAVGLMAGGIQAGEFLMHYDEDVNGTALDYDYISDELDEIPAHASACGMIYSFYGRLSVGNMDPNWLKFLKTHSSL